MWRVASLVKKSLEAQNKSALIWRFALSFRGGSMQTISSELSANNSYWLGPWNNNALCEPKDCIAVTALFHLWLTASGQVVSPRMSDYSIKSCLCAQWELNVMCPSVGEPFRAEAPIYSNGRIGMCNLHSYSACGETSPPPRAAQMKPY